MGMKSIEFYKKTEKEINELKNLVVFTTLRMEKSPFAFIIDSVCGHGFSVSLDSCYLKYQKGLKKEHGFWSFRFHEIFINDEKDFKRELKEFKKFYDRTKKEINSFLEKTLLMGA